MSTNYSNEDLQFLDVTNTRNGERGTGNGERGMGMGMGMGMGNGELVYSGNPPDNSKWPMKETKREQLSKCHSCKGEFLLAVPR